MANAEATVEKQPNFTKKDIQIGDIQIIGYLGEFIPHIARGGYLAKA